MKFYISEGVSTVGWTVVVLFGLLLAVIALPVIVAKQMGVNLRDRQEVNQAHNRVLGAREEDILERESRSLMVDISDNPNDYFDKAVTVKAEIGEFLNDRAFTLEGPTQSAEILVISPNSLLSESGSKDYLYGENDVLRVFGTVKEFDPESTQEEMSIVLENSQLVKYDQKAVILAETVNKVPQPPNK